MMQNNEDSELEEQLSYFDKPEMHDDDPDVPTRVRKGVMFRIIPPRYFRLILISLPFLGASPLIALFFYDYEELLQTNMLALIVTTSALFFCLFAFLVGVYLIHYRSPYGKEWKKKLGYPES